MAGWGSLVMNLIGGPDPREALLRESFGGAGGGPTATAPVRPGTMPSDERAALIAGQHIQAGRNADGSEQPPPPPQPSNAEKSQNDISELLLRFSDQQDRASDFNRGLAGIIGAFQEPQAARQTALAFGVGPAGSGGSSGGTGGNASDMFGENSLFGQVLKVRERQAAFNERQRVRAGTLASIPQLAQATGVPEVTLRTLYENNPGEFARLTSSVSDAATIGYGDRRVIGGNVAADAIHKPETLAPGHTTGTFDAQGNYTPTYTAPNAPVQQPNDVREYEFARGQGYGGTFQQFQQDQRRAGASQVNIGAGTDQQAFSFVKEGYDAASAAVRGNASLDEAERAVRGAAITGTGADQRLWLQKAAAGLGAGDTQAVTDTETFRAAIAPQVAATLKATVGSTQISDADRRFAQEAAGGSITLDKTSILRLIDIQRRANNVRIEQHNQQVDAAYPEGNPALARERRFFHIPTQKTPEGGGRPEASASPPAAPASLEAPSIGTKAEYDALPPGTVYVAPNGKRLVKSGGATASQQTGGKF